MLRRGSVCPHPGCEGVIRTGSNFCPRCGRPLNTDAAHSQPAPLIGTLGWVLVAILACFFCLPCFFTSFGHPTGFIFLAPPVFFFWQAFKKPPPRIPR